MCIYWDDQFEAYKFEQVELQDLTSCYPTFKESKLSEIFLENRVKVVSRVYPDLNKNYSEMSQNMHSFYMQVLFCSLPRSEEQTKNEW